MLKCHQDHLLRLSHLCNTKGSKTSGRLAGEKKSELAFPLSMVPPLLKLGNMLSDEDYVKLRRF